MQLATLRHPLTGQPITPLGRRRNGQLIWPIMGGSSAVVEQTGQQQVTGDQGGQQAGQTQAPTLTSAVGAASQQGATTGQQAGGQQQAAQQGADAEPQDGEDWQAFLTRVGPEAAARLALKYRTEAGDRRQQTRATEQQLTQQQQAADAAKAQEQAVLGVLRQAFPNADWLPKDAAETDPQKIAEGIAAKQAEDAARDAASADTARQLAVYQRATHPDLIKELGSGVNAERLLDSRSFTDTLAQLDPKAGDYGDKVVAAMKAAAKRDPSLKLTQAVARGGAQLTGGTSERRTGAQPVSLAGAIGAAYNQ